MHDKPELSKLIGMAIVRCDRCPHLFDIGESVHAVNMEYLCQSCWNKLERIDDSKYRYPRRVKPSRAGYNKSLDAACKKIKVKAE